MFFTEFSRRVPLNLLIYLHFVHVLTFVAFRFGFVFGKLLKSPPCNTIQLLIVRCYFLFVFDFVQWLLCLPISFIFGGNFLSFSHFMLNLIPHFQCSKCFMCVFPINSTVKCFSISFYKWSNHWLTTDYARRIWYSLPSIFVYLVLIIMKFCLIWNRWTTTIFGCCF